MINPFRNVVIYIMSFFKNHLTSYVLGKYFENQYLTEIYDSELAIELSEPSKVN
jgi:hypothetical protein